MATKVVNIIPDSAKTSTYDNEPKAYGQAGIPNVIDTSIPAYQDCCVSSYIYRSVGDDYQTKVPYGNHIKHFIELNAGAHYYVMSAYSDQYKSASMTVKISELLCNTAENRTAHIALSLVSTGTMMKQCDFGLSYQRDSKDKSKMGWYATSWSKNYDANDGSGIIPALARQNVLCAGNTEATMLDSTDTVEIVLKVIRQNGYDHVIGTVYKVTSTNKVIFARAQYRAPAGSFFAAGYANPYVRFTRFMSLVPINAGCEPAPGQAPVYCTDYADGSTLKGIIRDCKIDGQTWDKSKIAFAWSMQRANIKTLKISQLTSPSAGADVDEFEVEHATQTHGTPFDKS